MNNNSDRTPANQPSDRKPAKAKGGRRSVRAEIARLKAEMTSDSQTRRVDTLGTTLEARGLNARQEIFARALAMGATQTEAARAAGYGGTDKTLWETASKLARLPKVVARVAELKAVGQQEVRETREHHLEELRELGEMAKRQGNLGVVSKAIELRGRLLGLYVEKIEQTDVVEKARKLPVDEQRRLAVQAIHALIQRCPDLADKIRAVLPPPIIEHAGLEAGGNGSAG